MTLGSHNLDLGIFLNIIDTLLLAHIHPRSLRHFQKRSLGHLFRFDFLIAWFFRFRWVLACFLLLIAWDGLLILNYVSLMFRFSLLLIALDWHFISFDCMSLILIFTFLFIYLFVYLNLHEVDSFIFIFIFILHELIFWFSYICIWLCNFQFYS